MATAKPKSSSNTKRKTVNDLTEKDLSFIRKITSEKKGTWTERMDVLSKHFGGVDEKTVRNWMRKHNMTAPTIVEPEEYTKAKKRKADHSKKIKIVCSAQNNTPIHKQLWQEILAYAKFHDADIHVILTRYKNPNPFKKEESEGEYWCQEVLPYADANRHQIHKNLMIMSDIKIQPTATIPLTGFESISGACSAIFGHPKVQLDTLPALDGSVTKFLMTTGSVTMPNYSDSKAGKKGEFHHTFGFVIVEVKDKDTVIPRQVTACKDGSFSDLFYNVKNGKITKINEVDAFVMGDKHINQLDEDLEVQQVKLMNIINPKRTLVHDIFNGTSVNHHNEKDPILSYELQKSGKNLIKRELDEMYTWIQKMLKYNLVIVASNHNDWLDRYVKGKDWKRDISNAMEYMELTKISLSGLAKKGLIAYLIEQRFGKNVKTLGRDESYKVNEFVLSSHGDIGANGSRGGMHNFRKLSTKMIVADSHTPRRLDGVVYAGTSSLLRCGYNIGASSWAFCDVILHKDKKAQQILYIGKNRDFTTFKY